MPTGRSNHPLHNKMKQRENIADKCTLVKWSLWTMVNIFCCILVCGQKIFSKGARNGTKGKISDHSGELFKRKCQVIVERASKF